MPRPSKTFKRQKINASIAYKRGEKAEAYKLWEEAAKGGTRKNPLMSPIAKNLSNEQIIQLANYFSKQVNTSETNASKENTDENIAGKHVRARCVSCHGMQGFTVNDMWPNIAGQKKSYLETQLLAFKSGQRESPIMAVIAKELTKQQIADVAEYFSQQPANNK